MRFRAFLRHDRAAVAVEFAFVVPVMLAMLLCGYEASSMVTALARLNDSAQMMADLVSRQKSVSASQISDFCIGIEMVMRPFPTIGYSATVASVTRTAAGLVVDWQDSSCGSGQAIGSAAAIASPYLPQTNNSIIVVQASYTYHPIVNNAVAPSVPMIKQGFARTRAGVPIAHQ